MSATGKLTISGSVKGLPTGIKIFSDTITSENAVGRIEDPTLGSGDNTFAVPPGTTLVVVKPPDGNTVPIQVTILLHPSNPSVLALDPSVESITLTLDDDTSSPSELNWL